MNDFFVFRYIFNRVNSLYDSEYNYTPDVFSYAREYEIKDGHKRLIDGSNNFGFFYKYDSDIINDMYSSFFELLNYMNRITRKNGATFILFNHPNRYQVQYQDWKKICRRWNFIESDFDLEKRNHRIEEYCSKNNILFIDPIDNFKIEQNQLYLKNDIHYNTKGHKLAAEIAADKIYSIINE